MFKLNYKNHITVGLNKFVTEQKWMIFVFILFAITYFSLTEGRLTNPKIITVVGTSKESVVNQRASFNIYIQSKNADKVKAISETNSKTKVIVDAVKNFGVKDEDIQVANMSVYRDQNYVNNVYVEGDWNVSVSIDVKFSDVSKVNDFTTLISTLDVNSFYGPNYTTDTTELDESELLESAITDAKTKATNMANLLDKKLGRVVYASEDGVAGGTVDYRMYSGGGMGGGADMMPGSSNVYKNVVISYELR